MYRVAIIQNESEMLRSGYANIILKLNRVERLSRYSFELFNVVNIQNLFTSGDNHLKNFDSLIITTNATSDKFVLTVLQQNKKSIEEFVSCGKGIFISSQKKLSTANFNPKGDEGKTKFLPDLYEFYTVERPKIEKDSGEGQISIYNNEDHILLQYPKKVTAEKTKEHCENNEFKKHLYRSHVIPNTNSSYIPIFVDTSYEEVPSRSLMMVNLVPHNSERIVISTIAIDWEFHENLLTNLISYITEGLPKVAFIGNANVKHGDFDFLLTSARLSKIAHETYDDVTTIKKELFLIHNTYIFSSEWDEQYISTFLRNINSSGINTPVGKKSYVRVYYFKKIDNILTLTQYSNFSTIDLMIDSSILWINSKFSGGMWGNSFWITHDILIMMHDIGIDIETYITPIIKDVRKHYIEFSYDGVIGATSGLLELFFLLDSKYKSELITEGITTNDLKGMLSWVIEKFNSQAVYDAQTVILTLNKYHTEIFTNNQYNIDIKKYSEMLNIVCGSFYSKNADIEKYSEIDLCRYISICLICRNKEHEIVKLLGILKKNQAPNGKWTNTGRTAHVLVFLLKNFSKLIGITNADINIDDMIYNGILYLRAEYNWESSNWGNDLQATAKAIHAIGLYNKQNKYSTQDFFKTLEVESDKIYSATVIHNVSESMRLLRHQSNDMLLKIETLIATNLKNQNEIEAHKQNIEVFELYENETVKEVIRARTVATICATLLIAFVSYLAVKHPASVLQELSQIDIAGISLGFVLGLVLTSVAQKTVFKSDLINRNKLKKNKLKKSKSNE